MSCKAVCKMSSRPKLTTPNISHAKWSAPLLVVIPKLTGLMRSNYSFCSPSTHHAPISSNNPYLVSSISYSIRMAWDQYIFYALFFFKSNWNPLIRCRLLIRVYVKPIGDITLGTRVIIKTIRAHFKRSDSPSCFN